MTDVPPEEAGTESLRKFSILTSGQLIALLAKALGRPLLRMLSFVIEKPTVSITIFYLYVSIIGVYYNVRLFHLLK